MKNIQPLFAGLVLAAATVAATPAPKAPPAAIQPPPAAAQQTQPPPQDAAQGFDVTLGGFIQKEANGACKMTYVLPLEMKLGTRTIVWACVK